MSLAAISFPNLDPVAISFGPVAVKWYGLAYMAGLLGGWVYVKRMLANARLWQGGQPPFAVDRADDLLLYMTLGVVAGGRLGEVLFYEPGYYLANPSEILAVWKGGMSFHGGLAGSIIAILLFAWRSGANPRSVLDLCAAATPIGLFFGRIANFINAELWGRPTAMPWGVVFPGTEAGGVPRHPSQLYEAMTEGAILFAVLWWLVHRRDALARPGVTAGTFMAGYAIGRAVCEPFRDQDWTHLFAAGWLTPGIVYSIPMLLIGAYLLLTAENRRTA